MVLVLNSEEDRNRSSRCSQRVLQRYPAGAPDAAPGVVVSPSDWPMGLMTHQANTPEPVGVRPAPASPAVGDAAAANAVLSQRRSGPP
jgi:hypothetical protein